jgi:hypothetical protein
MLLGQFLYVILLSQSRAAHIANGVRRVRAPGLKSSAAPVSTGVRSCGLKSRIRPSPNIGSACTELLVALRSVYRDGNDSGLMTLYV